MNLHEAAAEQIRIRRQLRTSEKAARAAGLTPQRYLLLLALHASAGGRSTVTRLMEDMQIAQSTTTELVKRAVDAGLIVGTQDEHDRRVTWFEATLEGRRRLAEAFVRASAGS